MKSNFIHMCFIIDESGSMSSSAKDVVTGFNKMIKEQQENTTGECAVSLYKFNGTVTEVYVGKNVSDVSPLKLSNNPFQKLLSAIGRDIEPDDENTYSPGGCTAMNDGIGEAIDNIGKWLSDMQEEERPEKNVIVIMTDGYENASTHYSLQKVQDMIKHQTEKYSWSFVYSGTDITDIKDADTLGIKTKMANTRDDIQVSYSKLSKMATTWRNYDNNMSVAKKMASFDTALNCEAEDSNADYLRKTGVSIS